jgi:hypothetical protein
MLDEENRSLFQRSILVASPVGIPEPGHLERFLAEEILCQEIPEREKQNSINGCLKLDGC